MADHSAPPPASAPPAPTSPEPAPVPLQPAAAPEPIGAAEPGPHPEPAAPEQAAPKLAAPELARDLVPDLGVELAPELAAQSTPEPPPAPWAPHRIDPDALDRVFRTARTRWTWRDDQVSDDTIRELYDAVKLGPTSANCSPARFMFLRTQSARDRLRWTLSDGNIEKALRAPVVAIVAHDPKFYEDLPRLHPTADARSWFANNEELAAVTAFRNGTLQGGYLILAARALGLSCGPMSGFDNSKVDTEFLIATGWKSNFLVAMGYADEAPVFDRAPRLAFDEACRLL